MAVEIYGDPDDVAIEIRGDVDAGADIWPDDGGRFLAFSDGTVLFASLDEDENLSIACRAQGAGDLTITPAGAGGAFEHSDRAQINAAHPIKWVVVGTTMIRRKGD